MRIGQSETSQILGSELLGSSPGNAPQGFAELLLDALLASSELSQKPQQQATDEAVFKPNARFLEGLAVNSGECPVGDLGELCLELEGEIRLFPGNPALDPDPQTIPTRDSRQADKGLFVTLSDAALSKEAESRAREAKQGGKTESNPAELPSWVILPTSRIWPQAPLSSELEEAGDLGPCVFSGSCDGEQTPLLSGKIQQDSLTNSLGFAERLLESLPDPLESVKFEEHVFADAKEVSAQAEIETLGILQNQNKDSIPAGLFLAASSRESSDKESSAFGLIEKALEKAALASKDAQGVGLLTQQAQKDLGWENTFEGILEKPLGKNVKISDQGPSIEGAFRPKEGEPVKLFVETGGSYSNLPTGSGPQEQKTGDPVEHPEESDKASPKLELGQEKLERFASAGEFHPRGGPSHGLQAPDPGALGQKPAAEAALNQVAPEAQFSASGNSPGTLPEAPETKLFGEMAGAGFTTEPKAQVQADQFKDRQVVHMQMDPPDLGLLRVRLKVHKEGVEALFVTQGPEQKAALEQSLPQLRQNLAEQGFLSQRLAVDVGGGGAQWMSQEKADPGSAWGLRNVKGPEQSEKNQKSRVINKEQGILHLTI